MPMSQFWKIEINNVLKSKNALSLNDGKVKQEDGYRQRNVRQFLQSA